MRLASHLILLIAILGSLLQTAWAAEPQATEVVVRAKARDGKFIGSSIGSAWIRIRDADNGMLMAEGPTEGGQASWSRAESPPS